ncbi:MAG TPA: site-specific integrase [Verrucomicrobiales bacterium]|nr:site-specific integrase [Verrucomicrobiales bacterium]
MKPPTIAKRRYVPVGITGLYKREPGGVYQLRTKVAGRTKWLSLETRNLRIARERMDRERPAARRKTARTAQRPQNLRTLGDLQDLRLQEIDLDPRTRWRTKAYYRLIHREIEGTWPSFRHLGPDKVTPHHCMQWAQEFSKRYCGQRYNSAVAEVKRVFTLAVEHGFAAENPADALRRAPIRQKHLTLPTSQEFAQVIRELETGVPVSGRRLADLVRLLAFTGLRIGEARELRWRDVSLEKEEILVSGGEDGTKGGDGFRIVPLIPEAMELLTRLCNERPHDRPDHRVATAVTARHALPSACERAKAPKLTHHTLRHYFATRCIEAGVDIPTVSRWLGHRDGGALAMRTYGHLRDDHSKAAAKRVKFF